MNYKNILLIGMPGSGKSTLGKAAAESTGLAFVDTDDRIVEREKRTINDIFAENGEEYFRRVESDVLVECLSQSNTIVSAGGGIVKKFENVEAARRLGTCIIFIDRPVELILGDIDTSGRPLLKDSDQAERLNTLYRERYEKYMDAANVIIKNDRDFDVILKEIQKEIQNALSGVIKPE